MRFEEIISALREGKKARRKCWIGDSLLVLREGSIVNDRGYSEHDLCEYILNSDDWEVVKEKKKKYQGWVNLYADGSSSGIWDTKEDSSHCALGGRRLVETRLIEWEVDE